MTLSINTVVIGGTVSRSPELRHTASGTPVCNMSMELEHIYQNNGEEKIERTFVNVDVFGYYAGRCVDCLQQGDAAVVEGRIKNHSWEMPDGTRRNQLRIFAYRVVFPEERRDD